MDEKVYIVLLNYNGWVDTIECLESVLKLNYNNYQILLIDNSDDDDNIPNIERWATNNDVKIKTDFPKLVFPLIDKPIDYKVINEEESETFFYEEQLLIIKANQNKGFAAGNNIGLKYALRQNDYKVCWLLNNDTVVEKDSLIETLNYFRSNEKIGLVGSRLMYYGNPLIVQALGGHFNYKYSVSSHICEGEIFKKDMFLGEIDYPIGASMFITKECLKETGLMYEGFFLYYEEIEWAIRIRNNNYLIGVAKNSVVYHKEGASIHPNSGSNKSEFGDLTSLRSRLIFAHRSNKNNLILTYLGFIPVLFNRFKRFQFKRALKIVQIIFNKPYRDEKG